VLDQRLQLLHEARKEAEAALWMDKEQQKDLFKTNKNQAHEFQVGNKVWLSTKNIHILVAPESNGNRDSLRVTYIIAITFWRHQYTKPVKSWDQDNLGPTPSLKRLDPLSIAWTYRLR
jgi:hypothetical protein